MSRFSLILIFIFSFHLIAGQSVSTRIFFNPVIQGQKVELDKYYKLTGDSDSIVIETLKFYVSDLRFLKNGFVVDSTANKVFLIDAANPDSMNISYPTRKNIDFDQIQFCIGVDSITNVSGALGGALDPTRGMYWTWQSGYVNYKIEGKSNLCPSRKNEFQFHIGGYKYPFYMLQQVNLIIMDSTEIHINIILDTLLAKVNLKETYQVMSPNEKALEIAKILPGIFTISK